MYNDQLALSMTGCYWRSGNNVVERVELHDDVTQCAGKITSPLQNRCSSVNLVCEELLWYIKSRRTDFFTEWIVQVWGTLVATVGDVCNYIKSVDCEDCHRVQQHVKSWCRNKWAVETVIVNSWRFNRGVASSGSRRLQVFLISVSGELQMFELILLSSPNLLLRKFDAESYEIYYWLSMLSIDRSISRSCGSV